MTLSIKNMVCARCIMAVTDTLSQLGLTPQSVALGEAKIAESLNAEQLKNVREALQHIGFELVENREAQLIENIKQIIINKAHGDGAQSKALSALLTDKLHTDFTTLSRVFAAAEGRTIEKYYLLQRMERVKELIEYNELSIKEIAYQTGFSSVAHLSRQFKQLTGLTPTEYKQRGASSRQPIDQL